MASTIPSITAVISDTMIFVGRVNHKPRCFPVTSSHEFLNKTKRAHAKVKIVAVEPKENKGEYLYENNCSIRIQIK